MKVAVVRFREEGQLLRCIADREVSVGDYVIIEVDRGSDYGEVIDIEEIENFDQHQIEASFKKIKRLVNEEDKLKIKENRIKAREALDKCLEKVKEYKLSMKLVDAEYSFDRKKIIFYFTAEGRVDFRELVKDLAKIFKIRIEMRQIGVRDEARLFGGIGPCGQVLCCQRFLKNFEPVTVKMAKLQKLSLTSKISGICGRLMCCLFYEYKTYHEYARHLPREGKTITTQKGKAKVISVNILKQTVEVQFEDGKIEILDYSKNCKKDCCLKMQEQNG